MKTNAEKNLTKEKLHDLFEYKDGELYWRQRPIEDFKSKRIWKAWNSRCSGKKAGSLRHGYEAVTVGGDKHYTHRIVFMMFFGYLPRYIDHADGNPLNNKIENLRPCTARENSRNACLSKNNTSGTKGVYWARHMQKWQATATKGAKVVHLGFYDDVEEARDIATKARDKFHGEFARHV